jgi:hypothetical protein
MTLGQSLVIGSLNFHLIRILILFGLVRIAIRGELFRIRPTAIDVVVVAWLMVSSFLYVLFDGQYVALTERMGYAYNALGVYVLVRAAINSFDDIVFTVKLCAVVVLPLAVFFTIEHVTGRNPFAVLGGVSSFSEIRDGKVRCQGPFKHPILAGTFGATIMPLFVGLWMYGKGNRLLAAAAIAAATTIVYTSASSGPLSAFAVAIAGLMCWTLRNYMRFVRWGIVMSLVALDIVMKAPIWFLIDRLSSLIGGDGWYRSALIDAAVGHFDEWWLIGTGYTVHWMPTGIRGDANSTDLVNEFVAQGVHGGLLSLLLFIWLIVMCFKATGRSVHNAATQSDNRGFLIWAIGCGLLGHVASFFSVSYFDQIIIFWYLTIGMSAALVHEKWVTQAVQSPVPAPSSRVWNARLLGAGPS